MAIRNIILLWLVLQIKLTCFSTLFTCWKMWKTIYLMPNNCFPPTWFQFVRHKTAPSPGYIMWHAIHVFYDEKDKHLETILRKAPKLSYKSFHSHNNKQNIQRALVVLDDAAVVSCSYFPDRDDMNNFLKLCQLWGQLLIAANGLVLIHSVMQKCLEIPKLHSIQVRLLGWILGRVTQIFTASLSKLSMH